MNDFVLYEVDTNNANKFSDPQNKPHQLLMWDELRNGWTLPIKNFKEEDYSLVWNELGKRWVINSNLHCNRKSRSFHLWPLKNENLDTIYSNACTTNEYSIENIEKVSHGTSALESMVIKNSNNAAEKYSKITKHITVLNLDPIAKITYQEFNDEYLDDFYRATKVHPQCSGRTIQELFRLIIEWAWSYTELSNSEPMALLSHKILCLAQMPLDVRVQLLRYERPQYVEKFINGNQDALNEYEDDPKKIELFDLWISYMYFKYKDRKRGEPLNFDPNDIPDRYSV